MPRPFGDLPVIGTPRAYVEKLSGVGLRPILLPGEHAVDLLDLVDALVLTGGGDVNPALSGVNPVHATGVDHSRDEAEVALVRAAAERRIPLLGCCRGLQVLAVAFGGTLRSVSGHVQPGSGHEVRTKSGSAIGGLIGHVARTTSLHQQATADLGTFWQPTAWASGIIEAIVPVDDDWPVLG
ncbi:MAG: gamma-glutamyl-gamma-aminobutyrate hydrolase family protein, partial [Aeromicrobium sp.]